MGDFNLRGVIWNLSDIGTFFTPSNIPSNATEFITKMNDLAFFQLSNIMNSAFNVLDLIFSNDPSCINICEDQSGIVDARQQDKFHKPYELSVDYCSKITGSIKETEIYSYKRGNYQRMCQQIERINFQHEFSIRNTDEAYEYFAEKFNKLVLNNVPRIKITKRNNKPEWWSTKLQNLKNRRDKAFKRKPKGATSEEYERACKDFNELSDKLQNDYINRIQNNIKLDPATFWKFAKIDKSSGTYPTEMHYLDQNGATPNEIVELFATYFESIYDKDDQVWDFSGAYQCILNSEEVNVSLNDIELAINSLKTKGGIGPDEISPYVIKMCVNAITWPLWLLYQKTFDTGIIPGRMKSSRVVPVFKKGKTDDIKNYRVIAISSVIMKIFERAMRHQLTSIIEPHLSNAQHGFRAKRSVTTNLMNLSIIVNEAFDRGNQVDIFYGDFKNAFDKVCHRLLVIKMSKFGIGIKTAKWLCEFLIGRVNSVRIGNARSRMYTSSSGVPAGSILGPLLFTIFINDIVDVVKNSTALLFADDIKVFYEIRCSGDTWTLQKDIDCILNWCKKNYLFFNCQKCAIFTARRTRSFVNRVYTIDKFELERKNEIRDLGVLLDQRFSFASHIENVTVCARQMIGYIKRVSNNKFTIETKKKLYLAYVRSKLEFASVIWSPYQDIYKDDIESIQKQFVIYLLESRKGATSFRLAPYAERCEKLNIKPLILRRNIADAMFAYDVFVLNINDSFISSKFVRINYTRRLRNTRLLEESFYRTDYLQNQPLARMIYILNRFVDVLNDSNSRGVFKSKIVNMITENTIDNDIL
uniref:Putative non-LTR retrovirus reverse transcriptase n=1 Tax=Mayetiola destructor TaxID=39758 RepID=F6KPR2_MAYDE|nr:putative non-LTR retrovirus reverse transcriptase [Mayetiola destructor]